MAESSSDTGLSQPQTSLPSHRVPEAADYELKKQYLGLLPQEQIIEICLKLDMFAVSYIRSTVWPMDLNAAIDALRTAVPPPPPPPSQQQQQPSNADASTPQPASNDSKSPDKQPELPQAGPGPSTAQNYQRQGFPYSSSQPYPHTPYYAGSAGFSYSTYQSYPGANQPQQHAPVQHQDYNAHLVGSSDDLPSYEEMIVQALQSMPTPEGVAPKDLFTWMAAHYPVQANFRPSASQALQKAYKRGRFEKTPAGKYKLKPGWDGPVSSKRTTRRPQHFPPTGQFGRMPVMQQHQPPQHNGFSTLGLKPDSQPATGSGVTVDAFEAARNILTAINAGELLSLPTADSAKTSLPSTAQKAPMGTATMSVKPPEASSSALPEPVIPESRTQLQAQLALLAAQLLEFAQERDEAPQPAPEPQSQSTGTHSEPDTEPQPTVPQPESEPEPQPMVSQSPQPDPQVQHPDPPAPLPEDDDDEDDDDDMEQVIV